MVKPPQTAPTVASPPYPNIPPSKAVPHVGKYDWRYSLEDGEAPPPSRCRCFLTFLVPCATITALVALKFGTSALPYLAPSSLIISLLGAAWMRTSFENGHAVNRINAAEAKVQVLARALERTEGNAEFAWSAVAHEQDVRLFFQSWLAATPGFLRVPFAAILEGLRKRDQRVAARWQPVLGEWNRMAEVENARRQNGGAQ